MYRASRAERAPGAVTGAPAPERGREWRPTAALEVMRLRARVLAEIRAFFAARGVLEVETPLLAQAGATAPHLASLATRYTGPGAPRGLQLYLQTSPEYAMKRLLAAGSGPIYQIAKAFRDGEAGRLHNPEFTLLEWYRPGLGYRGLMDEVEALLRHVLGGAGGGVRTSYGELFRAHLGLDPHTAGVAELRACAARLGIAGDALRIEDRDGWLDLLFTHGIEPLLGRTGPCLVCDYPASQAALARIRPGPVAVAERFEVYLGGIELANGYQELTDAAEQRARFERDRARRRAAGGADLAPDERLLAALAQGLPPCSGVALGVDRLVMLAAGAGGIEQVIAFPIARA